MSLKLIIICIFISMVTGGLAPTAFSQSCGPTPCPSGSMGACPCGSNGFLLDKCTYPSTGCPSGYAPAQNVCCCSGSPVVISFIEGATSRGEAFPMSTVEEGVWFSINDTRKILYQVSWPVKEAQVAFVVKLPANYVLGKDFTFDGADLFGNFTPQPLPTSGHEANGYAALAVWDLKSNGGNADGLISMEDQAVQLGMQPGGIVLWVDDNHDGVSQSSELHSFSEMGMASIDISNYHHSHWTDKVGNKFRYTAPVTLTNGQVRSSFDVFFVLGDDKPGI